MTSLFEARSNLKSGKNRDGRVISCHVSLTELGVPINHQPNSSKCPVLLHYNHYIPTFSPILSANRPHHSWGFLPPGAKAALGGWES